MPSDISQRFLFSDHDWRGEIVCLRDSYQTIMQQHGYPLPIRFLLGEALLAAVLMASTMKFEGQLTLQFEGEGVIEMLVAKCTSDLEIRGLAQWAPDASADELANGLHQGQMVITLQQPNAEPYQSIVPIEAGTISLALERYFLQSEQLPSLLSLAIDEEKATGVLLQMMPSQAEQDPAEHWPQAQELMRSLPSDLLLAQDNELILTPMHDAGDIRLFPEREVAFNCPCSVARMERAIVIMGEEEVRDILISNQEVEVVCEYCNNSYSFDRDDVDRLFR